MSQRRPSMSRRGHRVLVASGLTAALVTVPGLASASETEALDTATSFLEDVAAQASAADPAAQDLGLPVIEVPAEVRAAFQQLADAAGLPENCVDDVADAIELIINGLITLPLELVGELVSLLEQLAGEVPGLEGLEEILEGLLGGLTGGLPGGETETTDDVATQGVAGDEAEGDVPGDVIPAPPTEPEPELPAFIQGLLALGEALQGCIPAPPTEEPAPEPEPENPPVAHPLPEQPAPPAAQPVAQPVSYPGYAPTGADTARADDVSVPLTALGGGLVLVAAGAAGYGMRGRAVRTRD